MSSELASTSSGIFRILPSSRQNKLLLAAGIGAVLIGGSLYFYSRCKRTVEIEAHDPLDLAEQRKAEGIETYKQKNYNEAITTFMEAIQLLEVIKEDCSQDHRWQELISSCQNNIAACHDALGNTPQCIKHCTDALRWKPNYTKALLRRARCYSRLSQNLAALNDYMDLVSFEELPNQMMVYQNEIEKISEEVVKPDLNKILQERMGKPMKISQALVSPWMFNTVINDPLLVKMATLDKNKNGELEGIDLALKALKKGEYDKVAELASAVLEDDSRENLERAQAVVLCGRFLHYQALPEKAREIADRFGSYWDKLDESEKLANKDLHVAFIYLQMSLIRAATVDEDAITESNKQKLIQLAEEGMRINPKNVDPLMVLGSQLLLGEYHEEAIGAFKRVHKLDPLHPYASFFEIYASFLYALKQQQVGQVHNKIVELEQAIHNSKKPPVFALLMLNKIGILMQNNQIAFDAVKDAVKLMPNCASAVYLFGLLDHQQNEIMANKDSWMQYVQRMERAMYKAIELDPNYWEPYRMLTKIEMDRNNFAQTTRHFDKAIECARSREELMTLLKERFMANLMAERNRTVTQKRVHKVIHTNG